MLSCQPLLGVNLSPEFVNLYFPYAGWGLLYFCWWQRHFEFRLAHGSGRKKQCCAKCTCMTSNLTFVKIS